MKEKHATEPFLKKAIYIVFGIIIGIANVIPGVSGGTLAVMLGIYDRLIGAISGFFSVVGGKGKPFISITKEWVDNLVFLLLIALGGGVGVVGFAKVMQFLLGHAAVATYVFFIGLIAGSIPLIYAKSKEGGKRFHPQNLIPFALALVLVILLSLPREGKTSFTLKRVEDGAAIIRVELPPQTILTNATFPPFTVSLDSGQALAKVAVRKTSYAKYITDTAIAAGDIVETKADYTVTLPSGVDIKRARLNVGYTVITAKGETKTGAETFPLSGEGIAINAGKAAHLGFSGVLAAGSMIVPGISGSFVLILMGAYETVIQAVNERDLVILAIVAVGALLGLLIFTKVIDVCLKRFHGATYYAILGLIVGSIAGLVIKVLPGVPSLGISGIVGVAGSLVAGVVISRLLGGRSASS